MRVGKHASMKVPTTPTEEIEGQKLPDLPEIRHFKYLRKKLQIIKKKIELFLESTHCNIFMTVVTIYALFADDVRQSIPNPNADDVFYTITSIAFGTFILEIILSSLAKPRYFLTFFFWLDTISTASLILDIGWISNAIFDTSTGGTQAVTGAASLARAARASRVGARAARIVRIVRLIRLVRIVKLYKAAQSTLAMPAHIQHAGGVINEHGSDELNRHPTSGIAHHKTFVSREFFTSGTGVEKGDDALAGLKKHNEGQAQNVNQIKSASRLSIAFNQVKNANSIMRAGNRLSIQEDLAKKRASFVINEIQLQKLKKNNPYLVEEKESMLDKDNPHRLSINLHVEGENAVTTSPDEKSTNKSEKAPKSPPKSSPKKRRFSRKPPKTEDSEPEIDEPKEDEPIEMPQETNVGKKLSDLTTKRVITLVLSVLITIPLFSSDTYVNPYTAGESGLRSVWLMNQTGSQAAFLLSVKTYISDNANISNPLITLNIQGDWYLQTMSENYLRDNEKQYYYVAGGTSKNKDVVGYACFNQRPENQLNAFLGIGSTLFVTLVLAVAALSFSKDTNDLVLAPIESMLVKVKRIAANPLAAAQIEEEDALWMEELEKQGKLKSSAKLKKENYETNILEKTILKLGALLALGFGEAGSNIIAQNMSKGGEVDPMIPGKKVIAIFGFCDIRNFTDATEVLQEGVMVFVNEIADVVHRTINEFSGAANKNIGDAFLLVWKIPDEETEPDINDPSNLLIKQSNKVNQLADMAVISFLKVIAGVVKSKRLEKYKANEGLNARMANYHVKMGFGLHVGWAIEGAIGSEYKIDASYLSPNVNMASRLEGSTKAFGVPILISGEMHDICTAETKKQLRHIDRVSLKGSTQPMDLYTCDIDYSKIPVDKNEIDISGLSAIEKKKARVFSRNKRDDLRKKAFSDELKVSKLFYTDKDILSLRQNFTKEFFSVFKDGMNAYIAGEWDKAKDFFERTLTAIAGHRDGPSQTLLEYMKEFEFRAPQDWKGYREYNEK